MPARMDYSVSLNVQNYIAGVGIVPGQCAISNGTAFILATAANIAANPGNVLCIALTQANAGLAFSALAVGIVPPDIFNLGPGASQYAGLSAGGGLQRQATSTSAVGYVDASGTITFLGLQIFANLPSANAITALTGGGTASGPGSAALTLALGASAFVTGVLAIVNGGTGLSSIGSNGTVLTSNGTTASWQASAASGAQTISGDATGTISGTNIPIVVGKINGATVPAAGALTPGNYLRVSGTSALSYSALLTADLPTITLTGDTTGSGSAGAITTTTGKINGVAITGTPTAGNQPIASSSTAAVWGALNLAGGAAFVTGALPAANQAAQTMGGDVTGTTAASIVSAISGSSPIAITPNSLQWISTAVPVLTQADVTTASATGALSTHRAQNATGTTSIGGSVRMVAGTGTTRNGETQFYSGSTQRARIFEAQQHHLQLGDGAGDATALLSTYSGYVINDTTYGTSALVTRTSFTFFWYPTSKSFLLATSPNLGMVSPIVPLVVDGSGNAVFKRSDTGTATISACCLGAISDSVGTTPLIACGFSGQTATLFTAQVAGPIYRL